MKKTVIFLLLALLPLLGCANDSSRAKSGSIESETSFEKKNQSSEILTIVNQFSGTPGFEVVKMGSLGTSLLRGVIAKALDEADEEEKAILDAIKGIKKIAIIDYSECSDEIRQKFSNKVSRVLDKDNLLMSIKDDGSNIDIFGIVSEDGSKVKDFVLHTADQNALICLFGTIPMDKIMSSMQ